MLGIIVTVTLLLTLFNAQVKKVLVDFFSFVESVGMWGPLFVSIFYIPATVLFFPGSIITLGAGFVCQIPSFLGLACSLCFHWIHSWLLSCFPYRYFF